MQTMSFWHIPDFCDWFAALSSLIYPFTSTALAYAETHYSFRGIYSRLKKSEPEIIADVPFRIQPGQALPVLIFIKDAHLFPVMLEKATIELTSGAHRQIHPVIFPQLQIQSQFWHHVVDITPDTDFTGTIQVHVRLEVVVGNRRIVVENDNYTCTHHRPFDVFLATDPLPGADNWLFGELHSHSNYTNDQVEFGAPLPACKHLAKSMGLHYFCATDHSYDLDDITDDYLKRDPELQKWHAFHREVAQLNDADKSFLIVPGEEVSVGNADNANVHLLILNHPEFLPGSGDSAEKWLRTRPTLSISKVLSQVNCRSAAVAAHPEMRPPLLERWFVRRGKWQKSDYDHENLHAIQIWNGSDAGFAEGRAVWKELLLSGKKIFVAAGNDAHGNFNRYRQIAFPFLTMREHRNHIFGNIRTAVFVRDHLSMDGLLEGIRRGNMVITDGPFIDMTISDGDGAVARPGDTLQGDAFSLQMTCLSSPEFGHLQEAQVIQGDLLNKQEKTLCALNNFTSACRHTERLDVRVTSPSYIRMELRSSTDARAYRCFTNPIWLHPRQR